MNTRRVVMHIITGLEDGGAEGVLYRLCCNDAGNLHVVVSLTGPGKYMPLLRDAAIEVHCLGLRGALSLLPGCLRLWRLLRRVRPDVVQTWMYHADLVGGICARLAGVGALYWGIRHSTLDPSHIRRTTRLMARICARLSYRVPRQIVCCGEVARAAHVALGYDSAKMLVIENGYDTQRFSPDPASRSSLRAELGIGDEPVLGMVARFNSQKGHRVLLQALAQLHRSGKVFRLLLAGAGMDSSNEALVEMLLEYGLLDSVELLGSRSDIGAIMNALDLHVLSSVSGEGFPNVVAEAMACGTPSLATNVGDAARIVGDAGWLVPPGDAVSLAQALELALQERKCDKAAWEERRRRGIERIRGCFSLSGMVAAFNAAWFPREESAVFQGEEQ